MNRYKTIWGIVPDKTKSFLINLKRKKVENFPGGDRMAWRAFAGGSENTTGLHREKTYGLPGKEGKIENNGAFFLYGSQ